MSNLKQQALALLQYTQDSDEVLPLSIFNTYQPAPPGNYWSTNYAYWQQVLYPYAKNWQVFYCPAKINESTVNPITGNYGVNTNVLGLEGTIPKRMASIQSPATLYLFMDSGRYLINQRYVLDADTGSKPIYLPGAFATTGIVEAFDSGQEKMARDYEKGRHFSGVAVSFADGHVKWMQSSILVDEAKKCESITACVARQSAWNHTNSG